MIGFTADGFGVLLTIHSEHGSLHGRLALLPEARGLVILVHDKRALDARDDVLAGIFRHAGLSTVSVNLLSAQEEHFPDVHNNVPLLAKRLLEFLDLIKNKMLLGEIEKQALGLFAANATSPVVVRVAALRDHDIAAIVCRGGLIDLAGTLYLHSLAAPILMLVGANDEHLVASNRRALQEASCHKEMKLILGCDSDFATTSAFEVMAHETTQWFLQQLPPSVKIEASPVV